MSCSLRLRALCALITALVFTGCPEPVAPCPVGEIYDATRMECVADVDASDPEDAGPMDSGAVDGGPDAGPNDGGQDAGTDGGVDAGMCATDCGAQFCSFEGNEPRCVDCDSTQPCGLSEPVCDTDGLCQVCTVDTECEGRTETPRCSPAGACVACNADGGCGGSESCNLLTFTCEPRPEPLLDTCEPCTNSDQCGASLMCFKTSYMGAPHNEHGYCLPAATLPLECPSNLGLRFGSPLEPIEGGPAVGACAPDPDVATCENWAALNALEGCEGVDDRCGLIPNDRAVPGALCRESVCSYPCVATAQCIRRDGQGSCTGSGGNPGYCRPPAPE